MAKEASRAFSAQLSHAVKAGVPTEALAKDGGPDRDQTDDLIVANDALYQLSYWPKQEGEEWEKLRTK